MQTLEHAYMYITANFRIYFSLTLLRGLISRHVGNKWSPLEDRREWWMVFLEEHVAMSAILLLSHISLVIRSFKTENTNNVFSNDTGLNLTEGINESHNLTMQLIY